MSWPAFQRLAASSAPLQHPNHSIPSQHLAHKAHQSWVVAEGEVLPRSPLMVPEDHFPGTGRLRSDLLGGCQQSAASHIAPSCLSWQVPLQEVEIQVGVAADKPPKLASEVSLRQECGCNGRNSSHGVSFRGVPSSCAVWCILHVGL